MSVAVHGSETSDSINSFFAPRFFGTRPFRWSANQLKSESLGRSHRSKVGKARLKYAIEASKRILGTPDDYLLGIVSAPHVASARSNVVGGGSTDKRAHFKHGDNRTS